MVLVYNYHLSTLRVYMKQSVTLLLVLLLLVLLLSLLLLLLLQ